MDNKQDVLPELNDLYKKYKKSGEAKILSELIRRRGLVNVPWPKGLAKELADLLDAAYSESAKKTLAIDDSWMFFIYWREAEFKTGKKIKYLQKKYIKIVQEWFVSRGTPKNYELIRSRLRQEYTIWRENLSSFELERFRSNASPHRSN